MRAALPAKVAVIVLLGCAGQPEPDANADDARADDAQAASAAPTSAAFTCDESASAEPEALRRLTMTQYRNTLRDLVRWLLGDDAAADAALSQVVLDTLPADRREITLQDPHGSYRRLDQALDQTHVDETYRVAAALGAALSSPERLSTVAGACATDADASDDDTCVAEFIRRFGTRALRRPLDAEDERFYRSVYGSAGSAGSATATDRAGYADVITVMLSSPDFLYFVEHGEAEVPGKTGSYVLSAHELAQRLSYHFWQTLPDDALWQTAEDGTLLEPDVLAKQVERLMADSRTRATMAEWFSDWLGLPDLPALDAHAQDPVFAAFAGSDLPGPELRQHVIDEALDMLAYYTWTDPAGVDALFTSELSFARDADLARIYGVEPIDGAAPPKVLPAGDHAGLLTHAWFLVSGSANTRPIQRGVFVRRRLLCDELAPPPASANAAVPPALVADKTTRRVVEELTEQSGTVCVSCHATAINPLGFAFEGFDALGRGRGEQRLFDDTGALAGALPVDTRSVARVTPGDARVSSGPADLAKMMLQSGKLEACLARNYFRFAFGRREDVTRDGCALERLRARLVQSGRIRDMLAEAALLPELRQRRFEP